MTEQIDPYATPRSAVTETETEAHALVSASKGRRFGTFIVDYVGFFLVMLVLGVVMGITGGIAWFNSLGDAGQTFFSLGIFVVYYLVFEGALARTPGKFLFGTMVVNETGGKPSLPQVLGRTFCRFIPFEAFSVLLASDDDVRGWHDKFPKTRVVRVPSR